MFHLIITILYYKYHFLISGLGVNTAYNSAFDVLAFAGIDSATNSIQLYFRGTAGVSIKDWIEDFEFRTKYEYCRFILRGICVVEGM